MAELFDNRFSLVKINMIYLISPNFTSEVNFLGKLNWIMKQPRHYLLQCPNFINGGSFLLNTDSAISKYILKSCDQCQPSSSL